jgi:hypothetical protein
MPTLKTFEWNRDKLRKLFKKTGMYTYYNNCCGGMLPIILVASFFKTKIYWSRFYAKKWSHLLNYVKKFVSLVGNIVCHDKIHIYASFGRIISFGCLSYMLTWVCTWKLRLTQCRQIVLLCEETFVSSTMLVRTHW